ncbi:amino acid adenylation domain-containing protein [Frateuria sp. MAH-13]|uniref:Amino acid adenylation domain-containing protein n=1 Tax=Frateuria flava TaxID=2821489 RepID=A0ABS4DJF9_9GAMM|nr:non-ribosomal peptide synthetase [Frateuria flava]MBP1473180.1 amino acid adenylation domain-containing protein [Frateuria flava]
MSTLALIAGLRARQVKLHLENGRLKVSAPKGALTPELVEQIRSERDAITALLMEARGGNRPPIPRRDVISPTPASFAQQRLWFIDQLDGATATYNMPAALRLRGTLDIAALRASIQSIVDRHETLRTTFSSADGEPLQVIVPHLAIDVPLVECSESDVMDRVMAFSGEPFDLAKGPLLRAQVLCLGPQEHILLTNMHHIISDGWSIGVLVGEFVAQYEARIRGVQPMLPPLPIQYADFALWQRKTLQGEVLQRQQDYWRDQLADLPPLLTLPTDRPRPPVQGFAGASHTFVLPATLCRSLKELSQAHGATLFMALLAAFKVLLARYSGQSDIAVGTPIANRTRPELEGLIGFFVNTLVLRSQVHAGQTFEQLLQDVRTTALAAYEHQDLPFEQLVEFVNPQRSMSHSPLFQVMFSLQNTPNPGGELPGLTLTPLEGEATVAKFDLQLDMEERDGRLEGRLYYRTDLFDIATIESMANHYSELLRAIAASPGVPVSALSMISAGERAELLRSLDEEAPAFAADRCLHEIFSQRAAERPDAVAVRCEGRSLSYAELEQQANRLARHLRAQGVGPDAIVGLCLERSEAMIVGLLAVLKAGGAYLPIDPACPRDRFEYILSDAAPAIVLTQQSVRERIPSGAFELLTLDQDNPPWAALPADAPQASAAPNQLAYVIYTSGSTGRPKGVMVEHRQVARLFTATDAWFGFNADDVWTLFHSYAFDFSVWELWGALLYGGCLVVVPYWVSRSPEDFHALLCDEKVTVLNQTPSAFRALMKADASSSRANTLRCIVFGGEALDLASLRPWFERHGARSPRLINMYGITETTVHVTYRPITHADVQANRGSVIGEPIPDLRIHLLDSHGQLAPVGVPGEMYVGGAGVARGYLNQPELTAQRFVDEGGTLLGTNARLRLYRTGDLARRLPDGDLEYLGRIDAQVKIRGFRIELGEIESALTDLPGVKESVVITVEDADGDKRLAAYVVGQGIDLDQVRRQLGERLPEYMVPSYFMQLDAMPLTINGKLDRRALPEVDMAGQSRVPYAPPETDIQLRLVDIWSEVLKREVPIGIHDGFFEIGGHSLLATQLVTRVRQQWGIDLPLRRMFETPTIHEMASYIEMTLGLLADSQLDPADQEDHEEIEV